MSNKKHPINLEWEEYYEMLESIRASGICNMWGASPYLAELSGIPEDLATEVLLSWIENYSELAEKYNWRG